jgi:hypothetical protein
MKNTFLHIGILIASLLSASAWADGQAPVCNPTDEDTALFQGKTAREFFANRAAQHDCVTRYEKAKNDFSTARATLTQMVAAHAAPADIDRQEAQVDSLRTPYMEATAECGPCIANPITDPVEVSAGGRTQIWYKTDGSCQLPTTDREELSQSFDRLTRDLTHLSAYPRQPASGKGYDSILDVTGYDTKTGNLDHTLDGFDGAGSSLFLEVKGPLSTAFIYYFFDKFQFGTKGGLREFIMQGTAVPPVGFTPPRILSYTSASGKKHNVLATLLGPGSQTTWYVNEDGYLRYCATADMGIKSDFIKNFGRLQMLDLLVTSAAKAQGQ